MTDKNGVELSVGQSVKERNQRGKTKIISLDDPFVYVRRANAYDDAPVFPEDLTVIETHEVVVSVLVKCNTEDEAAEKIKQWATAAEKSLPSDAVSYNVSAK